MKETISFSYMLFRNLFNARNEQGGGPKMVEELNAEKILQNNF